MSDPWRSLQAYARTPDHIGDLRFEAEVAARAGRTASLQRPLHPELDARLRTRKIDALWTHQADAVDALRAREDIAVATSTASGKSLCYQLPILDGIVQGRRDTTLLIFPTKALAQDQLASLRRWLVPGLMAVTYDGDTDEASRRWARTNANVVLTNPEMLHLAILAGHKRWTSFLKRLRYVVIDELHTLRGTFGAHVGHVLRRLQRVCAKYGSTPTFCFTSATIGNPAQLASTLCGRPVRAIVDDGAPHGDTFLACWERPVLDPDRQLRVSANDTTASLLAHFVGAGHPTIAFCRSRVGSEVVARLARERLADAAGGVTVGADRVKAYRAGFLPAERRELETELRDGTLLGVAATNALELGIDVGGIDAVVVNGFPGTVASLRQQAGRAGRAGQRACTVLVAGDDQLDQWYLAHPEELQTRPAEPAVVNLDNPFVRRSHVACAAYELPLTADDEQWFGPGFADDVAAWEAEGALQRRAKAWHWVAERAPAPSIGLRTGTTHEHRVVDGTSGELVATIDDARIDATAHPGAVYLHQGRQYVVTDTRPRQRMVVVEPYDRPEYTQARTDIDVAVHAVDLRDPVGTHGGVVHLGSVQVEQRVVGYQRREAGSRRILETVPLDLPARVLDTRACWYTVPGDELFAADLGGDRLLGAVHAAEHALIGLLPLFTICDRWDVGGVSMAYHEATEAPTIFVYDGYPGGAGIAELAFEQRARHMEATLALLRACDCERGCPGCVQSPKCGNGNEYLDKAAAITLLALLTD